MRKILKRIFISIFILIIVLIIGVFLYLKIGVYSALPEMKSHLEDTTYSTIKMAEEKEAYIITNTEMDATAQIIFFPGGKVKPNAYLPLSYEFALKGYKVILLKPIFNLAILQPDLGANNLDSSLKTYVGGHSLGGVVACMFYNQHKFAIEGIFLLASFPSSSITETHVLSIYGGLDGVLNKSQFEKAKSFLPGDTVYHEETLFNHSYYGYYGLQKGDLKTTITPEVQQATTASLVNEWIESLATPIM